MREFFNTHYTYSVEYLCLTFCYKKNKIYICDMLKALKYRIYPTMEQEVLINKHIGSVRFIYNLGLETKRTAYVSGGVNLTKYDLQKQLPALKEECEWLKEVNSQSLQTALLNLDAAFVKFFKGKNKFPVFKKKSNGGSFGIPQNISLKENKLYISKFREGIEIVLHRPIIGEIRQCTISKTDAGKFFASILCETGEIIPQKKPISKSTTVGIDLGIKTFLVTSDGKEYDNPKLLRKAQSKLKYVQRKYSKNKGKRIRLRLAKAHEKVANQRKDFLHKASSEIVKNHDSIAIENLNVKGMMSNHKLAGAIADVSWSEFVRQLEYKADWHGKNILQIGRFEPSSKTCSSCGGANKELTLKDREWTCKCGMLLNRDVNAAINIKNFALRNYLSGTDRKNHGELPTLVGVLTHETYNA